MMRVICSESYRPEREYAIRALFGFLLDESPEIEFRGRRGDYVIELGGNKRLVFPDLFFDSIEGGVDSQDVPRAEDVVYARNAFLSEEDIPVFYGFGEALRGSEEIRIDIDVFASCFFMLTRWEEARNSTRDRYARFPGRESLAYKAGFLGRPVVEEYAAMVRNAASALQPSIAWKTREFRLLPTHDVDKIHYYTRARSVAGKLLRGSFAERLGHLGRYISGTNPWWTFPWLMDLSERFGLSSTFFFLHSDETRYDFSYDMEAPRIQGLLREIRDRGHRIGLHGSYASYDSPELILEEKAYIERVSGQAVTASRQHFLRFAPALTWPLLDSAGIKEDYTAGYAEVEGFRCGTGESFKVFDLVGRRQLDLSETPLLIMDGTLVDYREYDADRAEKACLDLIAKCMRYRTKCSILFHNSSFFDSKWAGWDRLYEGLLSFPSSIRR